MKGRKPTPTALKVLAGNPGKHPLNRREPRVTPKAPSMPTTLSAEAKREWRRVVPVLERVGTLSFVNRGTLDAYCRAYARMVEADRHIQKHGVVLLEQTGALPDGTAIFVRPVRNPMVGVWKDAAVLVRSLGSEAGLTAASRTRLEVRDPADDDNDDIPRRLLT